MKLRSLGPIVIDGKSYVKVYDGDDYVGCSNCVLRHTEHCGPEVPCLTGNFVVVESVETLITNLATRKLLGETS
jgi:hypothetical protein